MPKHLTCRISDELDADIDQLAEDLGLSRSEVVRNALTAGVIEGKLHARRLKSPAIRGLIRALLAIDGDRDQLALFEKAVSGLGAVPSGEEVEA